MDEKRNDRIDEVVANLEELRRATQTGFAQVRAEFARARAELAAEKEWTRAEFADVRSELAAVRSEAADFRAEVRTGFEELRRYFDIAVEDFRATNRLLAEGLIAVNERVDRLETRIETVMNERFGEMRDLFRAAFSDHERRIRVLEGLAGV